jgi:hypothetical protein
MNSPNEEPRNSAAIQAKAGKLCRDLLHLQDSIVFMAVRGVEAAKRGRLTSVAGVQ